MIDVSDRPSEGPSREKSFGLRRNAATNVSVGHGIAQCVYVPITPISSTVPLPHAPPSLSGWPQETAGEHGSGVGHAGHVERLEVITACPTRLLHVMAVHVTSVPCSSASAMRGQQALSANK